MSQLLQSSWMPGSHSQDYWNKLWDPNILKSYFSQLIIVICIICQVVEKEIYMSIWICQDIQVILLFPFSFPGSNSYHFESCSYFAVHSSGSWYLFFSGRMGFAQFRIFHFHHPDNYRIRRLLSGERFQRIQRQHKYVFILSSPAVRKDLTYFIP